jgi:ATPase subunit of ABC transporter with duplicated ATPase domains
MRERRASIEQELARLDRQKKDMHHDLMKEKKLAAKTPKLLILDEITNNLDLETREHVIEVLKNYPGAMVVISHDADFLEEIGVNEVVDIHKFT